jgi:hypothetical protein
MYAWRQAWCILWEGMFDNQIGGPDYAALEWMGRHINHLPAFQSG